MNVFLLLSDELESQWEVDTTTIDEKVSQPKVQMRWR